MKHFHVLTLLWLLSGVAQLSAQATIPITLKVTDYTRGTLTPDPAKVFGWVAQMNPYAEQSNTGSWYSNFYDGYEGGKLTKTDEAWTWSLTFEAGRGRNFEWNPCAGTLNESTELPFFYGLTTSAAKNLKFAVSGLGTISGDVELVITDTYAATIDAQGRVSKKQEFDFAIALKVIDKTKGAQTTNGVLAKINAGQWTPMGSAEGESEKNEYEWIYTTTIKAEPGKKYMWEPAMGSGNTPTAEFNARYGLENQEVYLLPNRKTAGGNVLVIISQTQALYVNETDAVDYLGDLTALLSNDFLHAHGPRIVDHAGNNVQLRGIGLGNYMLLEPYMWGINNPKENKSDTQQAILASLAKLTSKQAVEKFMDEYRKNYMAEADVKMLKDNGFNSIRLPMHYNLFIEEEPADNTLREKGFALTDELLAWCKKHQMYLILDMHAVPGGQSTDKAISDHYSPGLWDGNSRGTAAQYQEKLIVLWREIARRYANEPWIAGYDLINEIMYYPSRNLGVEIRNLYERITAAIREVDKKHIIYIEGNGYANDHAQLTPPWDYNLVYSFHRYWTTNTTADVQYMLNLRNEHRVPVWMGESGENSNAWFTESVELLETHNIGWAWWAYKKLNNISGIVSIVGPTGWDKILAYLQSATDNSASLGLTAAKTQEILDDLARGAALENAKINHDVIFALTTQPFNNITLPYADHVIPGRIHATLYDMGRNGIAYQEADPQGRYSSDAGAYNNGWVGRNDAVDCETNADADGGGFNVGWFDAGEWLNYTLTAQNEGNYLLKIKYAVQGTGGKVSVKLNGETVIGPKSLPNTAAWNTYQWADLGEINMKAGTNTVQICAEGGFNLLTLNFEYLSVQGLPQAVAPTYGLLAAWGKPGEPITLAYNLPPAATGARILIYSADGQQVDALEVTAETHTVAYQPHKLQPGTYIAQLQVEGVEPKQTRLKVQVK